MATTRHTYTHNFHKCSHTSVGLTQACPNENEWSLHCHGKCAHTIHWDFTNFMELFLSKYITKYTHQVSPWISYSCTMNDLELCAHV